MGELELNVVFPGLSCDMLLDRMACWVRRPCSQLDLRMGQLWADGQSTLQLHQLKLIPEVDGFLTTSVVLPPDSEIVALFSVSGVRPSYCALVEPSRTLKNTG